MLGYPANYLPWAAILDEDNCSARHHFHQARTRDPLNGDVNRLSFVVPRVRQKQLGRARGVLCVVTGIGLIILVD